MKIQPTMNKVNKTIKAVYFLSILIVIFLLAAFLLNKHKRYKRIVELYTSNSLLILPDIIYSYYMHNQSYPESKEELDQFLQHSNFVDVGEVLMNIKYDMTVDSTNRILIYGYGYDNVDNKGEKLYKISDPNFVNTLITKGDIPLAYIPIKQLDELIEKICFYANKKMIIVEEESSYLNKLSKLIREHYIRNNYLDKNGMLFLKPGEQPRRLLLKGIYTGINYNFNIYRSELKDNQAVNSLLEEIQDFINSIKLYDDYRIDEIYVPMNIAERDQVQKGDN